MNEGGCYTATLALGAVCEAPVQPLFGAEYEKEEWMGIYKLRDGSHSVLG